MRTHTLVGLSLAFLALAAPAVWPVFGVYFVLIAALVGLSGLSVPYVLKRSLVIIPFVVVVAIFVPFFRQGEAVASLHVWAWQISLTGHGLEVLGTILAKAWLSILALVLLTATTPMTDLLRGLAQLRLPRVMVMILSFMYRYIFILADEVMRMKQARDSRHTGGSRLFQVRTVGRMAGTLFIRSYERGERVYAAMLARGYDGESRTLHQLSFRTADLLFGLGFGVVVVLTCIYNFLY